MLIECTICLKPILTEADPYGIWSRPEKLYTLCPDCFIKIVKEEKKVQMMIGKIIDAPKEKDRCLVFVNKDENEHNA